MNDARKKVQEFKKKPYSEEKARVQLDIQLPENYKSLSYHERNAAYDQANDEAIARHLGVVLTDQETWPQEMSKILANQWAQTLPEK